MSETTGARIPDAIKPIGRRLRRALVRVTARPKARAELHDYWRDPQERGNLPEDYLAPSENAKSEFLVELIRRRHGPEARIIEIGCNAGRNLHFLWEAGYRDLEAIEISSQAIDVLRRAFPDMASAITIHNAPVEQVVPGLGNDYDVVFSMAVLEHIHTDSDWVFEHFVRMTRGHVITIEDEQQVGPRHFARDYRKVFEGLGMRQVEQIDMEAHGMPRGFTARVFAKAA